MSKLGHQKVLCSAASVDAGLQMYKVYAPI